MAGGGLVLAGGLLLLALFGGKKKTTKKDVVTELPGQDCGLYPWLPTEVDEAALILIRDEGMRDVEEISLEVADEVYPINPEGYSQLWPPAKGDSRAHCLLDRIRIRVTLILAEIVDAAADLDVVPAACAPGQYWDEAAEECLDLEPGPGLGGALTPAAGSCPEGSEWIDEQGQCVPIWEPEQPLVCPPGYTADAETGECYPDYPQPGPFDVTRYEHPENYPQPGTFHQIGGPNSGTTLKEIAIKALAQFGTIVSGDPQWALEQAHRASLWKKYRTILNCVPTNHAYFASKNQPGTQYHYPTPHGYHINLYPRHDDVRQAMLDGRLPERFAHPDDPRAGQTRRHAWIWMPPLDPQAYLDGRIEVLREYWPTGDWMLMPPPEFTTWAVHEGIPGLPETMAWTTLGCEEYQQWEAA